MKLLIHTDGGSRGNPGPAAYGAVIRSEDGRVIAELAECLGTQTNNVAEYEGLVAALQFAVYRGDVTEVAVFCDSKLVVQQVAGRWKVKEPSLQNYVDMAHRYIARLQKFSITHIYREQNVHADSLVNKVLDEAPR